MTPCTFCGTASDETPMFDYALRERPDLVYAHAHEECAEPFREALVKM